MFARAGNNKAVERGRLHEGSLFGEMALVTEQARTASVQVVGEADLLEVDRTAVGRLCAEVPVLNERLDRFARERLLKNLLATSPLFKPFDHQQQMELLKRFEGHDLEPGTVIIREGDVGQGLFVLLLGEVEVLHKDPAGREKTVAQARRRRGVRRDVAARRSPDHRDRSHAVADDDHVSRARLLSPPRQRAAAAAAVLRGAVEAPAPRACLIVPCVATVLVPRRADLSDVLDFRAS